MKVFWKKTVSVLLALAMLPAVSFTQALANENDGTYDPADDGILSAYYQVDSDNRYLKGIAPGTSADFVSKVCLPGDLTADRDPVATGTVLSSPTLGAGASLLAIVTGDVNGDADVTITDLLMLKSHILGTSLSELGQAAGDINHDSAVTITDFLQVRSHLLDLEPICAGVTGNTGSLLILAPGESLSWAVDASTFFSNNSTIASVTADGTVTAGEAEGSAVLYASDENGVLLQSTIVSVLSGGVTVNLGSREQAMIPNQSLTLKPTFNHPVELPISWSSEDADIATVENGTVTAHSMGSTYINATLQNGNSAVIAISVIPPITELALEKSLYKVKPGQSRCLTAAMAPADSGEELVWTSADPTIATVDANGNVTGVNYGTTTVTVTGKYSGLTDSCEVKICDVKQVAITFDDGPSNQTPKLLDYLQEKEIKVTFFLVCNRINSFKDVVIREVNEGHEIGYHSYAHDNQRGLSTSKITGDFTKSNKILKDLTGAEFTLWRAPGGNIDSRVLNAIDLPHIMWSVDTRDWESRNTQSVYRAIMNNAKDGSIILLHDLYSTSVSGAMLAIDEMLAGDYEFVTVSELLSRDGTPPQNNTNYHSG